MENVTETKGTEQREAVVTQEAIDQMLKDPILSFPTQAQSHDEFRKVCRRGFILHDKGTRECRKGQIRGKAAVKARKRELRALREIQQDIAINGI